MLPFDHLGSAPTPYFFLHLELKLNTHFFSSCVDFSLQPDAQVPGLYLSQGCCTARAPLLKPMGWLAPHRVRALLLHPLPLRFFHLEGTAVLTAVTDKIWRIDTGETYGVGCSGQKSWKHLLGRWLFMPRRILKGLQSMVQCRAEEQ